MSTTRTYVDAPPEAVFDVLADPDSYGHWVVGSTRIRDADRDWPAKGTKFHHTIGVARLTISDHTESLEADPPRRLKLRAKGRPLGTATVTLELEPRDGGTLVRMTESPAGLTAVLSFNPLVHIFTKARNAESLMRLEELALRRAP